MERIVMISLCGINGFFKSLYGNCAIKFVVAVIFIAVLEPRSNAKV
jgi:hypothetical protein